RTAGRFHDGVGAFPQADDTGLELLFGETLGSVDSHGHRFDAMLAKAFGQQHARGIIHRYQRSTCCSFTNDGGGCESGCESFIHVWIGSTFKVILPLAGPNGKTPKGPSADGKWDSSFEGRRRPGAGLWRVDGAGRFA